MSLDLRTVSACLVTKEATYPKEVLEHTASFPFGEILVMTHSDSPHRKHELFAKAKFDTLYCSDDDAVAPIADLAMLSDPSEITFAQKPGHQEAYKDRRFGVGFGWGCFFPKSILGSLKQYTNVYGEDDVFKRETERIVMFFNYPQRRLVLPITDLPSAYAPDRLWRQSHHVDYARIAEERCAKILKDEEDKASRARG